MLGFNLFSEKKVFRKIFLTFCSLGHPETSAASAPAPPAAEVNGQTRREIVKDGNKISVVLGHNV